MTICAPVQNRSTSPFSTQPNKNISQSCPGLPGEIRPSPKRNTGSPPCIKVPANHNFKRPANPSVSRLARKNGSGKELYVLARIFPRSKEYSVHTTSRKSLPICPMLNLLLIPMPAARLGPLVSGSSPGQPANNICASITPLMNVKIHSGQVTRPQNFSKGITLSLAVGLWLLLHIIMEHQEWHGQKETKAPMKRSFSNMRKGTSSLPHVIFIPNFLPPSGLRKNLKKIQLCSATNLLP